MRETRHKLHWSADLCEFYRWPSKRAAWNSQHRWRAVMQCTLNQGWYNYHQFFSLSVSCASWSLAVCVLRENFIRMAKLGYLLREQFIMQKFTYYHVISVQQRTKLNNLAVEEGKSYFEPWVDQATNETAYHALFGWDNGPYTRLYEYLSQFPLTKKLL